MAARVHTYYNHSELAALVRLATKRANTPAQNETDRVAHNRKVVKTLDGVERELLTKRGAGDETTKNARYANRVVRRELTETEAREIASYRVTKCPSKVLNGAYRSKSNVAGGPTSHMGAVPRAFWSH